MTLSVRVEIIGGKRLERDLAVAGVNFMPAMERNVTKAAALVVGQAQRNVTGGTRTGAKYKIKGGQKVRRKKPLPVTAKRGQLAVFEGRLRQSITADVSVRGKVVEAEVGPLVHYGKDHEEGLNGQKKRPFLDPALKRKQEAVFRLIGKTFKVIP